MAPTRILHGFFIEELERYSGAVIAEEMDSLEDNVNCIAHVKVDSAWFDFHSPLQYHRPYAVFTGIVEHVRGYFPMDITSVHFPSNAECTSIDGRVTFTYEFSDAELSLLATIGLWSGTLILPKLVTANYYDIPLLCNATIILPHCEEDAPLVFVDTHRETSVISEEICGYNLGRIIYESVTGDSTGDTQFAQSPTALSEPVSIAHISTEATEENNSNTASASPSPTQANEEQRTASNDKPQQRMSSQSMDARKKALQAAKAGREAALRRSLLSKGELDSDKVRKMRK